MTQANNWLQARPVYALLFVLAPRPGLPEPRRSESVEALDESPHFAGTAQMAAHQHHHAELDRGVVWRLGMFAQVAGHARIRLVHVSHVAVF